jgi:hypothetical protein
MKGLKINMEMINLSLLFVILVIVIICCAKKSENFSEPKRREGDKNGESCSKHKQELRCHKKNCLWFKDINACHECPLPGLEKIQARTPGCDGCLGDNPLCEDGVWSAGCPSNPKKKSQNRFVGYEDEGACMEARGDCKKKQGSGWKKCRAGYGSDKPKCQDLTSKECRKEKNCNWDKSAKICS